MDRIDDHRQRAVRELATQPLYDIGIRVLDPDTHLVACGSCDVRSQEQHAIQRGELHQSPQAGAGAGQDERAAGVEEAEVGSKQGTQSGAVCGHSTLRIGAVELLPHEPCIRCTMVTRPQPDLGADPDIFRTLARNHRGHLGAWTAVAAVGTVHVGDQVRVEPR